MMVGFAVPFSRKLLVAATALVTVAAVVVGVHGEGASAATSASTAAKKWVPPTIWTPTASVDRTPVGSTPTTTWKPSVKLTGRDTSATTPGATGVAAGSLGVSPDAGSPAAGTNLGVLQYYGLETFGLAQVDDLQAQVNLANGNLVLHTTDLAINGPGLDLRLDRFYNSLATGSGAFGPNTVLSTGQDVGLQINASNVVFSGPSGFTATFTGTGPSYTTPAGINATLVKNGDGTYALTYNKSSEKLSFTSGGYLTKDADKNGVAISLSYNIDNTLASITDTSGRVTTLGYTSGKITSITDPSGRAIDYAYYSSGTDAGYLHTATETAPGVSATHETLSYDTSNRLSRVATENGNYTDFGYDSSNRVTSVKRYTGPIGTGTAETTTFAYPTSTETTETDPASNTTTYTLDTSGRVTAVENALSQSRSVTWTANSDLQTAVDAMSPANTTSFTYDSNNNISAVQIPTGAAAKAQYASGSGCTTSDSGHPYLPKCGEDAQGNQSSYTYDTAGNMTQQSDTSSAPNSGVAETYKYQGDAGVTSCGGKNGQICSATDGNANTTTYAYDSNGNLTTLTPPSPGHATTYTYDSLSRLASVTTNAAGTVYYSYNTFDELTRSTTNPSGHPSTELDYIYDFDGNQTTYERYSDQTVTYSYDGMNRELTWSVTGAAGNSATITYNNAGDVATYYEGIFSSVTMVTYTYNAANELTGVAQPGGTCTAPISGCTQYTYDANGTLKTTTYPGGTVQTNTLDPSGRPTEIKGTNGATTLTDFTYSYTLGANDTELTQTRTDKVGIGAPANSTTTYGYDTLDRLTAATEKTSGGTTNASWSYAYDKDGNRTSNAATISGTTTTTSQGYNAIDELTSLNGSSTGLSYDGDGNETANPGNSAVGVPARTSETNNPYEQLTAMTVAGTATAFDYVGSDNTNRDKIGSTTTIGDDMLGLTTYTVSSTPTQVLRTPGGQLIGSIVGASISGPGTSQYFLTDNQGSLIAIVNSTGTETATYAYDPYGRTRLASGTGAAANPLRYSSGYQDTFSGLTKLGARFYDPNIGRFTQPDPSGQENNPYAYTGDNPTTYVDPTGLCGVSSWSSFGSCFSGPAKKVSCVAAQLNPLGSADPGTLITGGVAAISAGVFVATASAAAGGPLGAVVGGVVGGSEAVAGAFLLYEGVSQIANAC